MVVKRRDFSLKIHMAILIKRNHTHPLQTFLNDFFVTQLQSYYQNCCCLILLTPSFSKNKTAGRQQLKIAVVLSSGHFWNKRLFYTLYCSINNFNRYFLNKQSQNIKQIKVLPNTSNEKFWCEILESWQTCGNLSLRFVFFCSNF